MKEIVLFFLIITSSPPIFGQIEWVSEGPSSNFSKNLFKTKTNQFVLFHGNQTGAATEMSVFDELGNLVYYLERDGYFGEYQIHSFRNIMHMPDSSVAVLLENVYLDTISGWVDFYSTVLKFDKQWNPYQIYGTAFSGEDVGGSVSDGSFILMTKQGSGVSRVAPDGGWIWAEWLDYACNDLVVTENDTIVIATDEGLILMNLDGDIITAYPDYIFKRVKVSEQGKIVGVSNDQIFILSPEYSLLFNDSLSVGTVEDFYLEGDTVVVLTDSNYVYFFNDALDLLNSFQLFDDGQFDFISINSDNVIISGTELYGGQNENEQTHASFLKEYSFIGDDYNLSNDLSIAEVGQVGEMVVINQGASVYKVLLKEVPVLIENSGNKPVNNFHLRTKYNSAKTITDFSIQPNESKAFVWDEVVLNFYHDPAGEMFNLCFWTSHPDDLMDINVENDFNCTEIIVNDSESFYNENISIYPNPITTGQLNIEVSGHAAQNTFYGLSLFDLIGREIMVFPFSNLIDLSQFGSGFFILNFVSKSGEVLHSEKLLLQN